jgi:hypothetical protein
VSGGRTATPSGDQLTCESGCDRAPKVKDTDVACDSGCSKTPEQKGTDVACDSSDYDYKPEFPNTGLAFVDPPTHTEKSEASAAGGSFFWNWLTSLYKRENK